MVRAIVFDFSGVVMSVGPLADWINKHIDDEEKRKAIFQEITTKGDSGNVLFDEFLALIGSLIHIPTESVYETIYGHAKVNREIIDLIRKLRKHYTIALFSNNQYDLVCSLLKQNNALQLFDEVVISSKYNLLKPQPLFFQKMLSILHIKKEEIVFFDDTKENAEAARQLGISAFLFKDAKQLQKDLAGMGITI